MIIRIIQARITIVAIKPIATSGFFETMRLIQFNKNLIKRSYTNTGRRKL